MTSRQVGTQRERNNIYGCHYQSPDPRTNDEGLQVSLGVRVPALAPC
jgi:hypothetical protein